MEENRRVQEELPDVRISENGTLFLTPKGEIDHCTAAELRADMDHALYLYRPKKAVIDLHGVTFMDSAGLGLLMGRYNAALEIGAELTVQNPSDQIRRIMELSGIDRLIPVIRGKTKELQKEGS